MIQLNLLPDVKLQYIKARQRKRLVMSVSIIASAFFLAIFLILLVYVRFGQTGHLGRLDKDIASKAEELKSKTDLNKVLTIQNQLNSLPGLHDKKVISSRLFDYLTQLTPTKATISDVDINFLENTLSLKGNADDLSVVNKFADTLKFTGFVTNVEDASQPQCALGAIEQAAQDSAEPASVCRAFSEVVLSEFSLGSEIANVDNKKPISYELAFKFDPAIFANIKAAQGQPAVALRIPKIISTRSVTEKPTELFKSQPQTEQGAP